jgi:glycosyltransferase involved in cell wall biosynthesis
MKVALVTNIPAPYRIPVLNQVAASLGDKFLVIFCAQTEPNRQWDLERFKFHHVYLKENFWKFQNAFIHNNFDVIKVLRDFHPDIVITTGFNPTFIYAWLYALAAKRHHIPMTDGWLLSENSLSMIHKIVRRVVYNTSSAFIGASKKSLNMYYTYGISPNKCFQSQLCINNKLFYNNVNYYDRKFDLMFSGQFIERKMPDFFVDVVCEIKKRISTLKVLLLGDGPFKNRIIKRLEESDINFTYAGHVSQNKLPIFYSQAKIFLFTTSSDPWGIVANEALASGTPVITTPNAGVANELVSDGLNGCIIASDLELWAAKITELLKNSDKWNYFHNNALNSVDDYTFDKAASGILAAVKLIQDSYYNTIK